MFNQIMSLIIEYFGKAFDLMADFQIGDISLLSFNIIMLVIGALLTVFWGFARVVTSQNMAQASKDFRAKYRSDKNDRRGGK